MMVLVFVAEEEQDAIIEQQRKELEQKKKKEQEDSQTLEQTREHVGGVYIVIALVIPRRSRRDIVLASSVRPSVCPSVRPFRPSVRPEPYLSTYWSDLIHSWYK